MGLVLPNGKRQLDSRKVVLYTSIMKQRKTERLPGTESKRMLSEGKGWGMDEEGEGGSEVRTSHYKTSHRAAMYDAGNS